MGATKKSRQLYEHWKQILVKELLINLLTVEYKSLTKISNEYHIQPETLKKLIAEYGIEMDLAKIRGQSQHIKAEQDFNDLKNTYTAEAIRQYYITEDHEYYDTIKHFNLTEWAFNKLLTEYNIHKDRSIANKRGAETKKREKYDL